eukprot:6183945-Pleurochrysis_carterae.AAC.6
MRFWAAFPTVSASMALPLALSSQCSDVLPRHPHCVAAWLHFQHICVSIRRCCMPLSRHMLLVPLLLVHRARHLRFETTSALVVLVPYPTRRRGRHRAFCWPARQPARVTVAAHELAGRYQSTFIALQPFQVVKPASLL